MDALFKPLQKDHQDQRQRKKHGDVQGVLQVGANQTDKAESRCGTVRVDQGGKECA